MIFPSSKNCHLQSNRFPANASRSSFVHLPSHSAAGRGGQVCDDTVLAFGASEQSPRSAKVFTSTADVEESSSAHSLREISVPVVAG